MNRLFWLSIFLVLFIGLIAIFAFFIEDPVGEPSKLISYTSESGQNLRKIEWDKHLWIILNGQCITHHPDCPCLKKEFEKSEETSVTE